MNNNEKPVLNKRVKEHTFYMKVWQDIPESINSKGNLVPAFTNEIEFSTVTKEAVSNENLSNWAMERLVTWLGKNKMTGKKGLKLSKDVNVEFTVDNVAVKDTMKFSLSEQRVSGKITVLSRLISLLFRKHTDIHKATTDTTIRFIEDTGKMLLVGKILDKPAKKKELKNVSEVTETVPSLKDEAADSFAGKENNGEFLTDENQ